MCGKRAICNLSSARRSRAPTSNPPKAGSTNSTRGRPCSPTLTAPLFDLQTADRPRDDQALDLRGPLEDRVDLGVAVHALDRELARVAVAAEDLDRPLGRPDRHLAGLELAHRALGVLEAVVVAPHPGGAPHEQPGRVD